MSIGYELHASNIDAMRRDFLADVAAAAPRDERTTYAQWDAAIHAYLDTLKAWVRDDDFSLPTRGEFCVLPGSSLPFSVYGFSYFRAWLRQHNLDPQDFLPDEPPAHMRDV